MPHIDNAAYAVVLSERVHTRVEEFGRVELQDTEVAALVRSKVVHMVLLVLGVLWTWRRAIRGVSPARSLRSRSVDQNTSSFAVRAYLC